MEFTSEDIGIKILEIITSGLYDGNLRCLREYIQNSVDSNPKKINIYFENENENLIIKDNGSGMDKVELKDSLGIGISKKSDDDVGWRGVGIWSGVPICNKIVIITRKENGKKLRVVIKNDELRNEIESNKKILNTLTGVTSDIEELEIGKDEEPHFTEVRLESVLPTQKPIFNEKDILEYLQKTIPVAFDEKKFPIGKEINATLKKNGVDFKTVEIIFKDRNRKLNPIYRPPYREDIFFKEPIYRKFKVDGETVAFGWFLNTNQNRKLPEINNGIFFKKKGFTIGDKNTVKKQWGKSYNEWQYGEIHIVSKAIKENAGRDYFKYNNNQIAPFLELVKEFIGKLSRLNHYQSNRFVSNHIEKINNYLIQNDKKSANNELLKINKKLTRKSKCPEDSEFTNIKKVIDKESSENVNEVNELKKEIDKTITPSIKEYMDAVIENMPSAFDKHKKKITKEGRLYPVIDIMQVITELLKSKIDSKENDIQILSKIAYGWDRIKSSNDRAILTITNGEKRARDMRFGLMIYTMYDLFINTFKHETGLKRFEWFEGCSEEEQNEILLGMYTTIILLYRLIEKSKICQPPMVQSMRSQ